MTIPSHRTREMMIYTRYTIVSLLLLLTSVMAEEGIAQQSSEAPAYPGTEYYISFPLSDQNKTERFMGIAISSEFNTSGTIEIPEIPSDPLAPITNTTVKTFTVRRGEVTMIEVPRSLEPDYPGLANHSGEASKRTVRLTSRAPVSVEVINARQGSSGAYPVLPVDKWGQKYVVTALPAVSTPSTADPNESTSQLLITAAHDGTLVEVKLSTEVARWSSGETIRDTLNQGEVLLLLANREANQASLDMTGTTISASKPVGVVAGHTGTPLSGNPAERFNNQVYSAWHALMQMPTDLSQWGTEYVATPMREGEGDRFRVIALKGTRITVELYDNSGKFVDQRTLVVEWGEEYLDVFTPEGMSLNGPTRWTGDQPFMLTQIRRSTGNYPNVANSPALVRSVPTTSFTSRSVFALPKTINNMPFGEYDLNVIAKGNNNPFDNLSLDGVTMKGIPNSIIYRITGDLWSFKGKIAPGAHAIHASGGVRFSGRVSGDNGSSSDGNVTLTWELPHWSAEVAADVTPPYIVNKATATNQVDVRVSDVTASYFSGVDEIAPYNSPGWDLTYFDRPFDADRDAEAGFRVKLGVDPSGPLVILLRDRDGNETTTQVHDGVCKKTAYAMTDSVSLFVGSSGSAEQIVRFDANPCGEEAHISWMDYDLNGSANQYLQSPVMADGGSLSYTIGANGTGEIRIKTIPNLPPLEKVFQTRLEVRIDNQTYSIPVRLEIDNVSGVDEEQNVAGVRQIEVSPNPFTQRALISYGIVEGKSTRMEIIDALGSTVREFGASDLAGRESVEWDGRDREGNLLQAGIYTVRVSSDQGTRLQRLVLVR